MGQKSKTSQHMLRDPKLNNLISYVQNSQHTVRTNNSQKNPKNISTRGI